MSWHSIVIPQVRVCMLNVYKASVILEHEQILLYGSKYRTAQKNWIYKHMHVSVFTVYTSAMPGAHFAHVYILFNK